MKRMIIFLILVLAPVWGFSREMGQNELIGSWKTQVLLAEREDGLLVNPDAEYAFPYLGISRIDILDSGFILFLINENEYRAFYEVEKLDFDNYHLTCTFKTGEELLLKLVRLDDESWKFLYRVSADSVLAPEDETVEETEPETAEPEAAEMEAAEAPENSVEPVKLEERSESLFIGILNRE